MRRYRKIIILAGLFVVALIEIGMYWNVHLFYKATEKIEDNDKKIKVLKAANRYFSSNDLVYYELGKAYFDLGIKNLQNQELRDEYLQESIRNFNRSLKINPASIFGHFNFAQSLLYMSYLQPSFEVNYYDEFKKAAQLTGHHSQIYYEVGKIFLSRWPELSEEDKKFTEEILNKIASKKNSEEIQALLQIWDMNVKDYGVIEKILPEDSGVYRLYAQFLGERSLSHEVRQTVLTQAELIEYEAAKKEYNSGQSEYQYYRLGEAFDHFNICLGILKRVKFYQNLARKSLINALEFEQIWKSTHLQLARCLIEQGKSLKDVEGYLRTYLYLENEVTSISELESFLREKGLLPEKLEESFSDLSRLIFHMFINFKQNRYRDIMRAGVQLLQSFVVIPEAQKKNYIEVLQIVGDASQKVDYVYDAREFYQKALEIDPDNLESLLRFRYNCERFNDVVKVKEIDKKLSEILTPEELVLQNSLINKGSTFSRTYTLDGRKITLDLHFNNEEHPITPLVSVFFNGRIVWESYLNSEIVSLTLNPVIGQNTLEVVPVNRQISLEKITYTIQ